MPVVSFIIVFVVLLLYKQVLLMVRLMLTARQAKCMQLNLLKMQALSCNDSRYLLIKTENPAYAFVCIRRVLRSFLLFYAGMPSTPSTITPSTSFFHALSSSSSRSIWE